MRIGARAAALFVLLGGAIGGLVTWVAIFVLSIATSMGDGGLITQNSLAQFILLAPFAALVGIPLGLLPSALTSWMYVSGPAFWRSHVGVALVGGTGSALEGAYVATLTVSASHYPLRYLSVVVVFAIAGLLAAVACHRIARRWPEFGANNA